MIASGDKALVVGGTGPTGPQVVKGLLDRGYEVTIYHRGYHESDALPRGVHHRHGDPFSREAFQHDLGSEEFDLVVSMYGKLRDIADVMAGRTRKFIGVGGIPALVKPEHLPWPTGREVPLLADHPTYSERDLDGYGFAVARTERSVMEHHRNRSFEAVMFRFAYMYGPRNGRQWMWPIVRRVLDNRRVIIVPGDGSQLRPACFADNACRMLLLACELDSGNGEVFNAVDEVAYSTRDTIEIVARALGHEFEIVEISHPLAYQLANGYAPRASQLLDSSKLKQLLGYRDAVPPVEGLAITARWLQENRDTLDIAQLEATAADPMSYELEDRLIASFKVWQSEAASAIPAPEPAKVDPHWRANARAEGTIASHRKGH